MKQLPAIIGAVTQTASEAGALWNSSTLPAAEASAGDDAQEALKRPEGGDATADAEDSKLSKLGHFGWASHFFPFMMHPVSWLGAVVFVAVQLSCLAITGDSLFGVLTGGVVESVKLETGTAVRWHMCSASLMWMLGAMQFVLKPFRHGRLAVIHRNLGRLFLFLWFFIAGPTAAYLSLMVGIGKARAQFTMVFFAVISMDTTAWAYYFFWRAYILARYRPAGDATWPLHGKAMSTGILFTMTILFQRPIQLLVIACRKSLLWTAWLLPSSFLWPRWVAEGLASTLLDHNVVLSLTTLVYGFPPLVLDGPRSVAVTWALGLHEDSHVLLHGSKEPSTAYLLLWRCRVPAYLVLRAAVTQGFSEDPLTLLASGAVG